MMMPMTAESVEGRFGKSNDERTDTQEAIMAGDASGLPPLSNDDYAEILAIMAKHGAFQHDQATEEEVTPRRLEARLDLIGGEDNRLEHGRWRPISSLVGRVRQL
jgi:hypothetical protein